LNGKSRAEGFKVAKQLLQAAGLEDKIHAMPNQLSGGEYIRVAVVRAMAHKPQVVFADEPTGNLDPVLGETIMQMLDDWRKEYLGRTLIVVTHNFTLAHKFCDRFVILSGGQVICQLNKSEISRSEDLHRRLDR